MFLIGFSLAEGGGQAEGEAETEPRAGEPAFFFNFVRVAYERFLAEDDEKIDEIKESVADAFGEQHVVIEGDVAAKRVENDRLKAEVEALRAQAVRRGLDATDDRTHVQFRLLLRQSQWLAQATVCCGSFSHVIVSNSAVVAFPYVSAVQAALNSLLPL